MKITECQFLQPKIQYRFTCFISKGDFAEDISPEEPDNSSVLPVEDCEEYKSPYYPTCNGGVINEKSALKKTMPLEIIEQEESKEQERERVVKEKEQEKLTAQQKAKERKRSLIARGYLPKDGDDLCVYSTVVGTSPCSFMSSHWPYNKKSPPPTYLSDEELYSMVLKKKDQFLKGFVSPPEGGLLCSDKSIMKRQSGVVASMIGQLITSMSTARISMPVRIFESKGMLERVADLWRFAPIYLTRAHQMTGLNRFRQVIMFALSGLYCSMQQLKPFNPLLGETFEATLTDGTQIYIEHTSHTPIIYNFLMQGANDMYKLYGHHDFKLSFSPNTMVAVQDGPNILEFSDGHKIVYRYPKAKIHGLIFGNRMVYPSGHVTFEDKRNNLKAVIIFNYGKKRGFFSSRVKGTKIDDISGIIYTVNQNVKGTKKISVLSDLKDVDRELEKITGSWLHSLKIANVEYWNINEQEPFPLMFAENPLPSDWRFREDIIWLRRNNTDFAQEWKLRLEAEQRRDRNLRAAYHK